MSGAAGKTVLALVLLTAAPAHAAPHPRHFLRDWRWLLGEAVIGAVIAADYKSTADYQRACPACGDLSPFIPPHARTGHIAAVGLVDFLAESGINTLGHYWVGNDASRAWRLVGVGAQPAVSATLHLYGFVNNEQFAAACRRSAIC